jgi:lysophospholipase L1-like esterase
MRTKLRLSITSIGLAACVATSAVACGGSDETQQRAPVNSGGTGGSGFGGATTGGGAGQGGFGGTTGGFGGTTGGFGGTTGGGGPGGTGGVAGVSGVGGVGTGGAGGTTTAPPCITNPQQVVIIGDSYVTGASSPALQPALAALVPDAASYRNYAVAGTSMGNGQIPSQFDTAAQQNPDINLVIMTGGGNDVLVLNRQCLSAGSSTNAQCQGVIQTAIDAATTMFQKMHTVGVSDVIYFFYPHLPTTSLLGGAYANEILDYSYPLTKASCDDALAQVGVACHFIDLRPVFEGHTDYIGLDGVHPTAAGQAAIAGAIAQTMQRDCLGQTGGCCSM